MGFCMKYNIFEIIVGAFVLCIAGAFFYFAYHMGFNRVDNGYLIYARFERVDGINVGTDVKISGVKIGKVWGYDIDPQTYQAKVALFLRQDVKLPADTSAEIISESLLGAKYISLLPGLDIKRLEPGDAIETTQSSINFETIISKFLLSGGGPKEEKEAGSKTPVPAKKGS